MVSKELNASLEAVRALYRPEHIKVLFVGESPPHSGAFFYRGNSRMKHHMQRAFDEVLEPSDNFLESFKARGCYLDDLVLTPVNYLSKAERTKKSRDAEDSLIQRIRIYQPDAIVCVLKGIAPIVNEAAKRAESKKPYSVPFPGMGNQKLFHIRMVEILREIFRK